MFSGIIWLSKILILSLITGQAATPYNLTYTWISDYVTFLGAPDDVVIPTELFVRLEAPAVPNQWVGFGFSGGPGMVRKIFENVNI